MTDRGVPSVSVPTTHSSTPSSLWLLEAKVRACGKEKGGGILRS